MPSSSGILVHIWKAHCFESEMLNYDNNSVTSASIKAHTHLDMVQYSVAMHAPMYLHQHHKFYIQLSLIFLQLRTLVVGTLNL